MGMNEMKIRNSLRVQERTLANIKTGSDLDNAEHIALVERLIAGLRVRLEAIEAARKINAATDARQAAARRR